MCGHDQFASVVRILYTAIGRVEGKPPERQEEDQDAQNVE
jgi:hypothetical protein